MKKEVNLIEHFDHLNSIEPSAEWNKKLIHRLDESRRKKQVLIHQMVYFKLVIKLIKFIKLISANVVLVGLALLE